MIKKSLLVLALAAIVPALALAASDDGAKLYKKSCVICHGAKGDGQGPAGKKLKPQATDFTKGDEMAKHTDEDLADVIKNGAKATKVKVDKKMPAYGKLTDEQIHDLVGVVRGFAKVKGGEAKKAGK
jgi:high-affinity iron transporter